MWACTVLLALSACDEEGEASDGGAPDAGDASLPDARVTDASVSAICAQLDDFIASHRSCVQDADCAIIGDCSHADFRSVARSAAAEAEALRSAGGCLGARDGPTYAPVCREGVCERAATGRWCGGFQLPPGPGCPAGTTHRTPGCGAMPAFEEGCYADCMAGVGDAACVAGYTCQQTWVHPCVPAPGANSACAACGMQTSLCLRAPSCELALTVSFDAAAAVARLSRPDASTEVVLGLENLTDHTLTVQFDLPCPDGPRLLAGFDPWDACLAGACQTREVRSTVILTPRQKLRLRSAMIASAASTCNPRGLADGSYALSFSLPGLTGATTCGPAPAQLIVGNVSP